MPKIQNQNNQNNQIQNQNLPPKVASILEKSLYQKANSVKGDSTTYISNIMKNKYSSFGSYTSSPRSLAQSTDEVIEQKRKAESRERVLRDLKKMKIKKEEAKRVVVKIDPYESFERIEEEGEDCLGNSQIQNPDFSFRKKSGSSNKKMDISVDGDDQNEIDFDS